MYYILTYDTLSNWMVVRLFSAIEIDCLNYLVFEFNIL